jgi:AcrR family transcriptional regulator
MTYCPGVALNGGEVMAARRQAGDSDQVAPMDPRVLRTRILLMDAARRLLAERGSTEVTVQELANAAGVSRRVLYEHFGDRDGLLVASVVDLIQRELSPHFSGATAKGPSLLTIGEHLVEHRDFYRAVLTGSVAYQTAQTVSDLARAHAVEKARALFGELDEATAQDVARYFNGATAVAITEWIVEDEETISPRALADRLERIEAVLTGRTFR